MRKQTKPGAACRTKIRARRSPPGSGERLRRWRGCPRLAWYLRSATAASRCVEERRARKHRQSCRSAEKIMGWEEPPRLRNSSKLLFTSRSLASLACTRIFETKWREGDSGSSAHAYGVSPRWTRVISGTIVFVEVIGAGNEAATVGAPHRLAYQRAVAVSGDTMVSNHSRSRRSSSNSASWLASRRRLCAGCRELPQIAARYGSRDWASASHFRC